MEREVSIIKKMTKRPVKNDWDFCQTILPKVSRTFAINIGHLDGDIFRTVLIGYLIFRIADTFEDNLFRDESQKVRDLRDYSSVFEGDKTLNERLRVYKPLKSRWDEKSFEKELIEKGDSVLKCYFDLPQVYREIIDPLIVESVAGMAGFQQLKANSGYKIFQLKDIRELEDYCYYVAGIVGKMLTAIFSQSKKINKVRPQLERHNVEFGLALQLVNVIKDYTKDIERGWCYIPLTVTKKYDVDPASITELTPEQQEGIIRELSVPALSYLDSTLKYIKLLPPDEMNIRMFCIIPFVLAYMTLAKLISMKGNKLTRLEVADLLIKCRAFAYSSPELERHYLGIKREYFI